MFKTCLQLVNTDRGKINTDRGKINTDDGKINTADRGKKKKKVAIRELDANAVFFLLFLANANDAFVLYLLLALFALSPPPAFLLFQSKKA